MQQRAESVAEDGHSHERCATGRHKNRRTADVQRIADQIVVFSRHCLRNPFQCRVQHLSRQYDGDAHDEKAPFTRSGLQQRRGRNGQEGRKQMDGKIALAAQAQAEPPKCGLEFRAKRAVTSLLSIGASDWPKKWADYESRFRIPRRTSSRSADTRNTGMPAAGSRWHNRDRHNGNRCDPCNDK
jgi:hypothetical protein